MPEFQDHFSGAARAYSRFRPNYPDALFDFLAANSPGHDLAWDAGTGSGQAVAPLRRRFGAVVATDASAEQLALAPPLEGVEYRNETAESTSLPDGAVDLVTVAAAVHWFDLDRFYAEARRVLRPGGIIAVWAYHLPNVSPAIDPIVERYTDETLRGYWPERSRHVMSRYRTLPFPFEEIEAPGIHVEMTWGIDEFRGFLGSWSGALAYRASTGRDPVAEIAEDLSREWGGASREREVRCPIFMRAGRV